MYNINKKSQRIVIIKEYKSKEVAVSENEKKSLEKYKKYIKIEDIKPIDRKIDEQIIKITAKFYIGVIKVSETLSLMIQPKISAENFLVMIQYVDPARVEIWKQFVSNVQKEQNFMMAFLKTFLNHIENKIRRINRRNYEKSIFYSEFPQGQINFHKTINQRNYISPIICSERFKFSNNTIYNQVIKYTLIKIKKIIPPECITTFNNLKKIFHNVEYRRFTIQEIDKISYDRITYPYQEIHKFCKLFIEDFSVSLQEGNSNFYSFIMNSWDIFERFLYQIFKKFQNTYEVSRYCPKNKVYEEENELKTEFQSKEILSKPDIILEKDNKVFYVIDSKYKEEPTSGDVKQIILYANHYSLFNGYLIFPCSNDNKKQDLSGFSYQRGDKVNYHCRYLNLDCIKNESYLYHFVSKILKDNYN